MAESPTTPPASPTKNTVTTRVLILSDTHNVTPLGPIADDDVDLERTTPFRHPVPSADVLLHCGDLTRSGHVDQFEQALQMLAGFDAELKLVIAGNHDLTLDAEYYKEGTKARRIHRMTWDPSLPEKARELWTGERAKAAGVAYLEEGMYEFGLSNGARFSIYASPYTPEYLGWAFAYELNEDRYSEEAPLEGAVSICKHPIPEFPNVDIIMTHGPPRGHLDLTKGQGDDRSVGCPHLWEAIKRARPRLHCFGHIHEAYGAQRVVWDDGQDVDMDAEDEEGEAYAQGLVDIDWQQARKDRCAFMDVSANAGEDELRVGEETLLVNASVLNLNYRPTNAPWLVDLELPVGY